MTFWTDERVAELRRHFDDGMSMTEIADAMGGVTRNGVIGKLHRIGLMRGHATPQRPRRANPPGPVMFKAAPPIAPARPAEPPRCRPCGLLDLTNERCRWVVSDDGKPFLFCGTLGADLDGGRPYCDFHSRIAYRRPGEREAA